MTHSGTFGDEGAVDRALAAPDPRRPTPGRSAMRVPSTAPSPRPIPVTHPGTFGDEGVFGRVPAVRDEGAVDRVPAVLQDGAMPGSFKTEGVVLRSIRFGEADRILHLYTVERGRVNAIAKGSRRPKSRFGGRLEPFFRLDLMLHEGRSDLCTVTGASTLDGYPGLRSDGTSIDAAARGCDAVLRLLDSTDPNRPAYNLLCRYLALLDAGAGRGPGDRPDPAAVGLAFRLKLALAAGFSPELASCSRCGEAEGISAFSGAAGGVVCNSCEGGGFPLTQEAHEFMVTALGKPIAELPDASERALKQAERAINETLEHHAHVRLRSVAA